MGKLRYTAIASLDGFVADTGGNFDWAAPDEEVHRFVNDLERPIGTHLYGRRMYEVMWFWDTPDAVEDQPDTMREYAAIWRDADKVVFSRQLDDVSTPKTTLHHKFDPELVRAMKASSERDLSIGGPTIAAEAIAAGLVDEIALIWVPHIVGGGTSAFPRGARVDLDLADERGFAGGAVYVSYRVNHTGESQPPHD
jgi:dihydrofolate reductase